LGRHLVPRQHQHLRGHEEGGEDQDEDDPLPREGQLGQGVAHQGIKDQDRRDGDPAHQQAVEEPPGEHGAGEEEDVVGQGGLAGYQAEGEDLPKGLERRQDHPPEGEDHGDHAQDQDRVAEDGDRPGPHQYSTSRDVNRIWMRLMMSRITKRTTTIAAAYPMSYAWKARWQV